MAGEEYVVVEKRWYIAVEREAFFRRLDRGGTIRGVCLELGFDPSVGYRWCKKAGLSAERPTPRVYSEEMKNNFIDLVRQIHNVSRAARILGIPRATGYKFAHDAGIFTRKFETKKSLLYRREQFLQLRSEGSSRQQAAMQVNVDKRTAFDWDKGVIIFSGGRIYPDGTRVFYNHREKLRVVENPRCYAAIPEDLRDSKGKNRFLTLVEREKISDLTGKGFSLRKIAGILGRSPSTISRELKRNRTNRG